MSPQGPAQRRAMPAARARRENAARIVGLGDSGLVDSDDQAGAIHRVPQPRNFADA